MNKEEIKLRRRLVFRLLRHYDFDNPVFSNGSMKIEDPSSTFLDAFPTDTFVFNFATSEVQLNGFS